ncbi:MAG: DUF302 domain-containing protein [Thermoanaerobaculia bacterium]
MGSTSAAAATAGFGMRRVLDGSFAEALDHVPEALKAEGFGVLTQIDVRQTLRERLGVEFRPYRILGACNPPLAHRALEAQLEIGLMLPCNVIVYEADDDRAVVVAVDPMQTVAAQGSPVIAEVAGQVREKLERVLDRLGGSPRLPPG